MSLQASQIFDVIIIGAGPAGSACAIELAKAAPHVRIALLEKGVFPKDKICGDALSPDVINQVKMLSDDLANKLDQSIHALPVNGVRIFGRKKASYAYFFNERNFLKSYTCPRLHLDSLLFEHTRLC